MGAHSDVPNLNDSIVMRGGKPTLKDHSPADAVDPLSYMFAKGIINDAELAAGERMARMRRGLFGFGVVPPPLFYGRMCGLTGLGVSCGPGEERETKTGRWAVGSCTSDPLDTPKSPITKTAVSNAISEK